MTLPKPLADPVIAEFRRVRLQRRSVPGQTYLLAVSTLYCRPVFEDDEAARAERHARRVEEVTR